MGSESTSAGCRRAQSGRLLRNQLMKKNKTPNATRKFAFIALALSLCLGIVIADQSQLVRRAQASSGNAAGHSAASKKVSPDLYGTGNAPTRVILQLDGKPSGKLNALLNRN